MIPASLRGRGWWWSAPDTWVPEPHERSIMPGSPAIPDHPMRVRLAFGGIAALAGITGGLGNGIVTANLTSLQGELGLYPAEAAWLPTVYVMTNVVSGLLLVKFRQQFGLRLFVQIFLVGYVLATAGHLVAHSFASAIVVRAFSGIAAASLSTLALLYMMQAFKPAWRLKGLVFAVGIPQLATPLARLFPSELLEAGQWQTFYVFELGLALLTLAAVRWLPLPPSERFKAFERGDFLTFVLVAPGLALLTAVLGLGRVLWWFEAPWLGYALCAAVVLLTVGFSIEHRRENPLLNTRWLGSGDILRFALVAILTRVVLAEQTTGAVGLLTTLGLGNEQMRGLFVVILFASIAGMVVGSLTLNPNFLGKPILIALGMIALGAFMDMGATNLTRPPQLYVSQAILGFAALLFIGPALLVGLTRALAAGPSYFVSFSVLFSVTQSLGGLIGAALIGTFQTVQTRVHLIQLGNQVSLTDPVVASRVTAGGAGLGRVIGDPALRQAEGVALIGQSLTREANILAYDDVFRLIGVIALVTMLWASIHITRIQRARRRAALAATTS
ncbi:MFS transporter [Sphingomonas arantia]|uniref:MFS transporter n=1 Tax=Sphingomonas arantia TaxID=1460676 RepID=A0ABW4TS50_9SPHN